MSINDMKPLGARVGTIASGTQVFNVDKQRYETLTQTIRVLLIARRNNTYSFVINDTEYIVHADNVSF